MPKLNVQQNNQNVIQAFKNALAIGNLKGIIASDGSHNFSTAGSNPNLLDNPWFTVRQRGDGPFTTADTVGIDRWKTNGSSGSVTGNSGYVSVSNAAGATFYQRLRDGAVELGETYTVSIMENDGTISTGTIVTSTNREYVISVGPWMFELDARTAFAPNYRFMVYKNSAWSGNFKAMKWEKGAFSTLANDAPPELSIARIPCYENHLRLKGQYAPVGYAIALSTTLALLAIPTPVPMRIAPTPSLSGTLYFNAGTPFAITSVQNPTLGVNQVMIQVVGTFDTGKVYLAQFRDANSYLDLSADL